MRSSRRYYRGRAYVATAGQKAARRHIEEGREFEKEMGGTVSDVKRYFFGLGDAELDEIFSTYGRHYGASAESYARQVFTKWRSGSTKMSGVVAKRLFAFLPRRMPSAIKLELAGNVWRHFGSGSTHYFTVGPSADASLVMSKIYDTLNSAIQDYNIPQNVKSRFDWLAAGDVSVKEQLLNYFKQMDKKVATESLQAQLPILQAQMRDHSNHTGSVNTKIKIHKHSVEIWIDPRLGEHFREGRPERTQTSTGGSGMVWVLIATAVIITIILLSHH
jgi:hypothetical protein